MGYHDHKEKSPTSVAVAVLTISDSRTEATDESGRLMKERLAAAGHPVAFYALLKNDAAKIADTVTGLIANPQVQVIITTGGTGAGSRDLTVETVTAMLDKKLDGFGELFRYLTYQELGTASIMSRALAGVAKGKVIICLPGSLGAVTLAMDRIILPELGHLVREATR